MTMGKGLAITGGILLFTASLYAQRDSVMDGAVLTIMRQQTRATLAAGYAAGVIAQNNGHSDRFEAHDPAKLAEAWAFADAMLKADKR